MPEELPLEPDLIKVLAADTRREILSQLQDRRMTVTELARELDMGKATIHEHLDKLTDADLVQRDEDDRLWVYYELTGRGKRLLNPQRTRFYLALASAAVAALVVGLAAWGFVAAGGFSSGPADVQQAPSVQVEDDTLYAGEGVEVPAEIEDADGTSAYLVDEEGAQRLREGSRDVEGLPLRAFGQTDGDAMQETSRGSRKVSGEEAVLRSDASLQPGTYYLYVRGAESDNAPSMPSIRLIGLEADLDRTTWYRGLDEGPLEVDVTQDGEPVNGTLRLGGVARAEGALTTPIREGQAHLHESDLDGREPGTYRLSVQPEDETRWVDLETSLSIEAAPTILVPLHGLEESSITARLYTDVPERLDDVQPRVEADDISLTDRPEGWQIRVGDAPPGTIPVEWGRQASAALHVHPALAVQATVHSGSEVEWSFQRLDGSPAADAAVYLDGKSLGFTDANGTLTSELPSEGEHRLTVARSDGESIQRAISVDGWHIEAPPARLSLEPADVDAGLGRATVTVEVANRGPTPVPVTLVADVLGEPGASRALHLGPGEARNATLAVPVDASAQEIGIRALSLQPGTFAYENATRDDAGNSTDDTAGEATADTSTSIESTTVHLPGGEDAAQGYEAADGESASPWEPIYATGDGADGDAAVAESAEETPAPAAAIAALVLALAAFARGRGPKA